MANAVLDVFEECLREAKVNRIINGGDVDGGSEESELAKQWRVQMMDDLDVLSRRKPEDEVAHREWMILMS
jgi:hypothetical protein